MIRRRAAAREAAFEAAFPPQGRMIGVPFAGRTVPVHAVIRGTGPDLILLHGASGNSREFTFDLIPRLEHRYRCIAFDRPGLGYTGRTDPAHDAAFGSSAETPAEQAALLAAAYARVAEDGPPLVLGHSFGGTVALAWALDHPVRALTLLAPPAMRWPGGLGPVYALTASALGGALVVPALTATVSERRLREITRRIFAPDPVPEGYFEHVGGQLTLRRCTLRANARQVSGLKPHVIAMEARYSRLRLPIEWLHGDADTIVPAQPHAHPFRRLVPATNLTILEGVGHMPHHVDPDAVVAAIDRAAAASS
ncbi:alpha/beta fold hydrolase [Jannaschia seosinensis]|nr:alpha/beta hydrolase [Jannaschia seosinensis]